MSATSASILDGIPYGGRDTATTTTHVLARLRPRLWRRPDGARAVERLTAIARLVAGAAPWLDDEALELIYRMNLWTFTIDDRFDEPGQTSEETLAALADRCVAVAAGQSVGRLEDPVLEELAELRRAAASRPLFASIGGRWIDAVEGVARGMLQECRWANAYQSIGAGALPTLAEYMVVAERSIGLLPHIWLTCLSSRDVSCVRSLAHLERMAAVANRCVRLANDLRTSEREAREGGVNALVILGHVSPSDALEREAEPTARSVVETTIAADLEELCVVANNPVTRSGRAERSIFAIARELCRFYEVRDFGSADIEARGPVGGRG
jgi:hypothetical protein